MVEFVYHRFLFLGDFSSNSCRDLSVSQGDREGQDIIEPRVDQEGLLASRPNANAALGFDQMASRATWSSGGKWHKAADNMQVKGWTCQSPEGWVEPWVQGSTQQCWLLRDLYSSLKNTYWQKLAKTSHPAGNLRYQSRNKGNQSTLMRTGVLALIWGSPLPDKSQITTSGGSVAANTLLTWITMAENSRLSFPVKVISWEPSDEEEKDKFEEILN